VEKYSKKYVVSLIVKLMQLLRIDSIDPQSMDFKIVVQKLAYIIQSVGGIDLGLKFKWLSRGPYSKALANLYNIATEMLYSGNSEEVSSSDLQALNNLKMFLEDLAVALDSNIDPDFLELVSSVIMLCKDVYPKIEDPVTELLKRKPYLSKRTIEKCWRYLKDKGICQ